MQKVIIDTNVIVSALISKSIPSRILFDIVFNKLVLTCLSSEVFEEYVEVLDREKFSKFHNFKSNAIIVLSVMKEIAIFFEPGFVINLLSDKKDNMFFELAEVSNADFLITGNTKDFNLKNS